MANDFESNSRTSTRLAWAIAVAGVVVLALFLRTYWNVDAAVGEDGFRLASGSDPYYHKRAIDAIQDGGWKTLVWDPLLNYPYGSVNPNPPLFEWSVAASGLALSPFFGGDLATATWWALLWNPAVMGALTVIPVYVIGAELFGRRAGILAGLFWALSTSSMDHTSLGASDHDAFYMFFLTLGFAFYIQFIHRIRGDPAWVARWSDGASLAAGLRRFASERRVALGYAVLTGVSLAAVALTWKGFAYATGIIFVYAGIQMVVDHWRNRDSTSLWIGSILATGLPVLLAVPYYATANVLGFLLPASYLVLGLVVGGLVLVPTRDLPSILVLPGALVVAVAGFLLTYIPGLEFVRRQLLDPLIYFRQSQLYQTIAEAHPAAFDDIVFGVGPIVFLVGFVALFSLLFVGGRRGTRDTLFTFVWGAIAIFMAQSAVRFLFNAVPIFAVLAAWLVAAAIAWFDFGAYARNITASGFWTGVRRAFSGWHVVGVLAVVLLLVMPSVLLAVDAAVPGEVEARMARDSDSNFTKEFLGKRLGAYSQGFLPGYWQEGLEWLDRWDAGIAPPDRPAFLSWWDYGHWAIAISDHPASADNFQNGYLHAGHFISARNETHAIQLLAGRQLAVNPVAQTPGEPTRPGCGVLGRVEDERCGRNSAEVAKRLLGEVGVADVDAAYRKLVAYEYAPELDLDQAAAFLAKVEAETGYKIRYFAVDVRMVPYDSPQTAGIDAQGIFYAPVVLAGKDVDDYVATRYPGDGQRGAEGYTPDEAVERIRQSQFSGAPFDPGAEYFLYRPAFFESMFWRAYAGSPPPQDGQGTWRGNAIEEGLDLPQPGRTLKHFRLIYINDQLRILQYVPGAKLTGTVTQDGEPVTNALVTVLDDAGGLIRPHTGPRGQQLVTDDSQLDVPHDRVETDDEGRFTVTAPFSTTRGITVVAILNGVEVGRSTVNVTREQAEQGATLPPVTFEVRPGDVQGRVFFDNNGDGVFNATGDRLLEGVNLTIGSRGATSGADGSYTIADLPPGSRVVEIEGEAYEISPASRTVRVRPGETVTHDVALVLAGVPAGGRVGIDENGDGELQQDEGLPVTEFTLAVDPEVGDNTAREDRIVTNATGYWATTLTPGAYVFRANMTIGGFTYAVEDRFTVAEGSTFFTRNFLLVRE